MHIVKGLVDELTSELTEHRRIAIPVGATVLVVVLAVSIASAFGSAGAVATIAVLTMVGTAVAVLLLTAHSAGRLRR
ncbi:MAG: hypothetical protein M3R63_20350 [Actinomycetota bacterium]|nr:hypothetical protein [Actinomycetota bacterium]